MNILHKLGLRRSNYQKPANLFVAARGNSKTKTLFASYISWYYDIPFDDAMDLAFRCFKEDGNK